MSIDVVFAVALAGLLSFLSPCVLPLVPPYLGYLGGTTLDQMTGKDGAAARGLYWRVVTTSIIFVLGFTTVFVLLGASASTIGQFIQQYKYELSVVAGVVIMLFGLHFTGLLRIPLFYREARFQAETRPASLAGAYVMGLAFAFGWTPCIGPVLGTVLAVAANEASVARGVLLLFVYSLGLGIPFILAAIAIKPFLGFMAKFRRYLGIVEKVMGVILIIAGLMFITGGLNSFGQWLLETFPVLSEIEGSLVPDDIPDKIMQIER